MDRMKMIVGMDKVDRMVIQDGEDSPNGLNRQDRENSK
jgi:hypothetical protein